jgi:hypothetical protein
MSVIDAALASPVSPGIAAAVWQAHEEQLDRMKNGSTGSTEMRGELKWTLTGGYQFTPDADALDVLMDRIAAGTWAAGFKVTVTL